EQNALNVLNSAFVLFEGKKFRQLDDPRSDERKAKFREDFIAADKTNPVPIFSLYESLMREGFIDGFDYALQQLTKAESPLAEYMSTFCILARARGDKSHYTLPDILKNSCKKVVDNHVCGEIIGRSDLPHQNLVNLFNYMMLKLIFKAPEVHLSPYFAYTAQLHDSLSESHATVILIGRIIHQYDGTLLQDLALTDAYDSAILKLVDTIRKTKYKDSYYDQTRRILTNAVLYKIQRHPVTKKNFTSVKERYDYLKTIMGEDAINFCPRLSVFLPELPPQRRIALLCSEFKSLNVKELIYLVDDMENSKQSHDVIRRYASNFFRKENPSLLEQQASLLKKAVSLNVEYSDYALLRLCSLTLMLGDTSLLDSSTAHGMDLCVFTDTVTKVFYNTKSEETRSKSVYVLKTIRDQLHFALDEDINRLIDQEYFPESRNYPNYPRMVDAQYLLNDDTFQDLSYLERLLQPVLNDEQYGIQACQMLYDLSLKIGNMEKAYAFSEHLVRKTKGEEKANWVRVSRRLHAHLNPQSRDELSKTSQEVQEQQARLRAEDERKEREAHQEWVRKQLELRKAYRAQHPEEEIKSPLPLENLPAIQFNISQDRRVEDDLAHYTGPLTALKTNYDNAIIGLKNGRAVRGAEKIHGTSVTVNGKKYALWHYRLNDAHRVFYYQIGSNIFIIQAFGHDLEKNRLPS
ncbi:MAG: hypothetical protein Q8K36_06225, partial [Alphaproteobacteria bacterium]|nr:hypothetical protein [Alphaproteobacteria bacterium]